MEAKFQFLFLLFLFDVSFAQMPGIFSISVVRFSVVIIRALFDFILIFDCNFHVLRFIELCNCWFLCFCSVQMALSPSL